MGSDLNPESKSGFHLVDTDGTARSEFRDGLDSDCLEPRPSWFFNILIITGFKRLSKIKCLPVVREEYTVYS